MIGVLNLMVKKTLKLLKKLLALKMDLKSEKSSHNLIWFQDLMN